MPTANIDGIPTRYDACSNFCKACKFHQPTLIANAADSLPAHREEPRRMMDSAKPP
jgi:hypothetical protein